MADAPNRWSRIKAAVGRLFRRAPAPGAGLPARSSRGAAGSRRCRGSGRAANTSSTCQPAGRAGGARRSSCSATAASRRRRNSRRARGSPRSPTARAGSCSCRGRRNRANAWRCWNWFDGATASGRGEAAIVAAMIRSVRRWHRADPARIVAVGMSAGGALAAVLGLRAAGLVRAAAVHSGIACGAALSGVHRDRRDAARAGDRRRGDRGGRARAHPARGAAARDPRRGRQRRRDGQRDGARSPVPALQRPSGRADADARGDLASARRRRARDVRSTGGWRRRASGGAMAGSSCATSRSRGSATRGAAATIRLPFNDAHGPDATALVADFVRDALA